MSTLTIRNLEARLKARLRVRAARNGRSMEAEVREILRTTLEGPTASEGGLGSRIHARFASLGGGELELPPREEPPRAADLGG